MSATEAGKLGSDLLTILQGDALEKLRELPAESVQCCVTSPPFWGLRNYGCDGQLGLEKTPEEFAGSGTTGMVAIELGRKATLIELSADYVELIKQRCNVTPGLALG